MIKRILVTGSNGQLGNELRKASGQYPGFKIIFTDLPELDITDQYATDVFFRNQKLDYLINCAAYTAVDKAESEPEKSDQINAKATALLAAGAARYNFKLVHISTDYVFNGQHYKPYTEDDATSPQSAYGKSKLAGEEAIRQSGAQSLILRTSWLYSAYGHNFVKTILRLAKERSEIKVVFDQVGTPTWAADLAKCILSMINKPQPERCSIYHYSNEGVCSWYDFAQTIIKSGGLNCRVLPVRSKEFPTPAPRPAYSVLDKSKIKKDFSVQIPWWQKSLRKCLKRVNNEK
jgi:dTDP-4-dehydrorhamnose reductase